MITRSRSLAVAPKVVCAKKRTASVAAKYVGLPFSGKLGSADKSGAGIFAAALLLTTAALLLTAAALLLANVLLDMLEINEAAADETAVSDAVDETVASEDETAVDEGAIALDVDDARAALDAAAGGGVLPPPPEPPQAVKSSSGSNTIVAPDLLIIPIVTRQANRLFINSSLH